MRRVMACLAVLLAGSVATLAQERRPTLPHMPDISKKVGKVQAEMPANQMSCEGRASAIHFASPRLREEFLRTCREGAVLLTNLRVDAELELPYPRLLVSVDVTAGPLTDTDTIRVALDAGREAVTVPGGGTATRSALVAPKGCDVSTLITARATWKTTPSGPGGSGFEFSSAAALSYKTPAPTLYVGTAGWYEGNILTVPSGDVVLGVFTNSADHIFTVIAAQLFCNSSTDGWRPCGANDPWSWSAEPTAIPVPQDVKCGADAVPYADSFKFKCAKDNTPAILVLTYREKDDTSGVTAKPLSVLVQTRERPPG